MARSGVIASVISKTLNVNIFTLTKRAASLGIKLASTHSGAFQAERVSGGVPVFRASKLADAAVETPSRHAVAVLDLQPHHCRWPLWAHNERPSIDSLFCGRPKIGGSYCRKHAKLTWR